MPPKPIFRLETSPERRGLLDATDLSSSSLQFPILQPKPVVKESAVKDFSLTNSVAAESHTQDSAFVVTPSFSYNSDTDSVFEVGTAQIGTAYGTSTNSQLLTPPEDQNMAVPRVRETNASIKRLQFNQAKLANTPETAAAKDHGLEVPSGNNFSASSGHIASMKDNGSPLPKNQRRSRSSLINDESSSPMAVNNVISRFSTHQKTHLSTDIDNSDKASVRSVIDVNSNDGLTELSTQVVIDSSDGVTGGADQDISNQDLAEDITDNPHEVTDQDDLAQATGGPTNQELIQVAVNTPIQAIAHGGSIDRSESQTTIGRKRGMSLLPSTRFARNADRIVLGTSPP